LDELKGKIDRLKGHSRRNNLRFIGIEGSRGENWQESEKKVRLFIRDNLCVPEYEHVEIERAHRIGGGIMVKFNKYKGKETILQKAKQTFIRNAKYYVQEDYTDGLNYTEES